LELIAVLKFNRPITGASDQSAAGNFNIVKWPKDTFLPYVVGDILGFFTST
jgi:hypothetical protein